MERKPKYCERETVESCAVCSLTNYGMDCHNNPISSAKSRPLRGRAAALAAFDGHHGPVTIAAVEAQIPDELRERLTGREYGLVMSAINAAYHRGRADEAADAKERASA